jgi:small-conductance mechanosensitive channel
VRYRVPVGVAAGANPREVETALIDAARATEGVLSTPPPAVRFKGFDDSALDFELQCWTSAMLHRPGAFRSQLNFAIYETLQTRGIETPRRDPWIRVPQREAEAPAAPPES